MQYSLILFELHFKVVCAKIPFHYFMWEFLLHRLTIPSYGQCHLISHSKMREFLDTSATVILNMRSFHLSTTSCLMSRSSQQTKRMNRDPPLKQPMEESFVLILMQKAGIFCHTHYSFHVGQICDALSVSSSHFAV